jgi:hypothetical protein
MDIDMILDYVFMIAFVIAILFIFLTKFIDLKVVKLELQESRDALNLLQTISTSSELLVKDSANQPLKLMFDKSMLDKYSKKSPDEGIFYDEKCCNSVQYDYNLQFADLKTGSKWSFGNLKYDLSSQCYSVADMNIKVSAQMPADICSNGKCDFSTVNIEMARTPLSELAFWISEVCLRKDNVTKTVPFDQDSMKGIKIDINKKEVCTSLQDGERVCKKFYCDNAMRILSDSTRSNYWNPTIFNGGKQFSSNVDCFNVVIEKSVIENVVNVTIPQDYRQ